MNIWFYILLVVMAMACFDDKLIAFEEGLEK